jgi:hypothetical protein
VNADDLNAAGEAVVSRPGVALDPGSKPDFQEEKEKERY